MHQRVITLLEAISRMDQEALEQWALDNGISTYRFLGHTTDVLAAGLAGHALRMLPRAADVPPEPPEWMLTVLDRVKRSMGLKAVSDGRPGIWWVTGGLDEHWVNLADPRAPACDCGDAIWRDRTCKHVIAARCASGEELHAVVRDVYRKTLAQEESHG